MTYWTNGIGRVISVYAMLEYIISPMIIAIIFFVRLVFAFCAPCKWETEQFNKTVEMFRIGHFSTDSFFLVVFVNWLYYY